MTEKFTLRNDPPQPKQMRFENHQKNHQKVLFSGLDCLPGQLDLFPTDGQGDATRDQDTEGRV